MSAALKVKDTAIGTSLVLDGRPIATLGSRPDPEWARRLAACWNACAGLSTEALEAGALKELVDVAGKVTPATAFKFKYSGDAERFIAVLARLEGKL